MSTSENEPMSLESVLHYAVLDSNEVRRDDDGRVLSYTWSLKGNAPAWTHGPIEIDTSSGYVTVKTTMVGNSTNLVAWSSEADECRQFDEKYDDDYHDLPDWLLDALCSLEVDGVIPEWELVYLTDERFVIHVGDDDTVATDEYRFDKFECGYHEPTSALYVRIYDDLPQPSSHSEKLPIVTCGTCQCSLSTFGLIGDIVTCEHCGQLNSVYAKDDTPVEQVPATINQTKQVNGRYGLWQHIIIP
jgi:hypothetical protein